MDIQTQAKYQIQSYWQDFDQIEGWFVKMIVQVMSLIDSYQQQNQIRGSVAEIGVYRGKSFIPLLSLCKERELALAVDCFENNQFNRDGSGLGAQHDKFMENVKMYAPQASHRVRVMQGDSMLFDSHSYLQQLNGEKIRIFSIDGGHTAEATQDDMRKAYPCLPDGGVIIIDDFFNSSWPGVGEGVHCFMIQEQPNLKPFFIGGNKVMFTHPSHVKGYIDIITTSMKPQKISTLFGSTVCIY